jgi:hypothetical protein
MEQSINPIKRKYKYAADYGFILGGYIAIFFILDFLIPNNFVVSVLGEIGLLATPVICYYLTKSYRDKALGGFIKFGQAWGFGIWLFFFASLIMSVFYYIRFEFLQPTYIGDSIKVFIQQMQQMPNMQKQIDALIDFGTPTTIEYILINIWSYIIGGAILYLIVSPFVVRKPNTTLPSDTDYTPYQETKD